MRVQDPFFFEFFFGKSVDKIGVPCYFTCDARESIKRNMTKNQTNNRDVRYTHVNFIYKTAREYASWKKENLARVGVEMEDFVQTFMQNIFKRSGFENFQIEWGLGRLETLVRSSCYRLMIEMFRHSNCKFRSETASGAKVEVVSLNAGVDMGDGCVEMVDVLPDTTPDSVGTEAALEKLRIRIGEMGMAYRSYSWLDILNLYSEHEVTRKVARVIGCTDVCASYLKMKLMGTCKEVLYS